MGEPRFPGSLPVSSITFNNAIVTGGVFSVVHQSNDDGDELTSRGRRRGDSGKWIQRKGRPQSLEDIVAFDALLNSNERYPAPKCHPDTRKVALAIATSWIWNRQAGFKSIMWVSGTPGVGKSALLQTTCEALVGSCNPIHASFFFSRGQGARELAASLAPTIAYQFTLTSIVCRWYIWYLLQNEPTILGESLHSQFRKLVNWPAAARSYVQRPMVVVIDGLDECVNVHERVSLLKLIFEAASAKSIRFLIASRPEQEIENFFKRPDIAQHVDHIILDEESFQSSKDIRVLLRSEFARIRQSRPDLTFAPVDGEEWPGDAIIDRVTVDSDGQFIFSTLFIGYLDDDLLSPQELLDSLLDPPSHVIAFSKLDRLYHQILTRRSGRMCQDDAMFAQYQETVKGILRVVIAWPQRLSITGVARVVGEEFHVIQNIILGPLRTLFKFQGYNIAFCHKSLGDCLLDPHRSGDFHVPPNALDLIYHHILSHPLSNPVQSVSQEQIVWILHVIIAWPEGTSKGKIASVLKLDVDTVSLVVDRFLDLLFAPGVRPGDDVVILRNSFKVFLLDPQRSGEYHVPPNALDLLYLRILSRPPSSHPTQTCSREQLIRVLHAIVAWPELLTREGIASLTGLDNGTVKRVLAPFMGLLFSKRRRQKSIEIRSGSFADFLFHPHRSREYHVLPNFLDPLYRRILSRPPPSGPTETFSREHLAGVLHALVAWPKWLTEEEMSSVLGIDSDTVSRVVAHFTPLLLQYNRYGEESVEIRWPSFGHFLLDPHRSGEHHVLPNTLDLLYLRILSRPPPSDPALTFSQEQLLAVLHYAMDGLDGLIVSTSSTDTFDTIEKVISGPQHLLFDVSNSGMHIRLFDHSITSFLMDPSRSGNFCHPSFQLYGV